MKRFLCKKLPNPEKPSYLNETESHHLFQVLRLRKGAVIEAIDGMGHAVLARVHAEGKGLASLEYVGPSELTKADIKEQVLPIILEVAVLKSDAMAWMIEKAVELGIQEITPVLTERTVIQIQRKGPEAFIQRWQKIADQALKQCGRLKALKVNPPIQLPQLLSTEPSPMRLVALESRKDGGTPIPFALDEVLSDPLARPIRLLSGPEGGFSTKEEELLDRSNVRAVSLGPLILRAETAAVFAMSVAAAKMRWPQKHSPQNA